MVRQAQLLSILWNEDGYEPANVVLRHSGAHLETKRMGTKVSNFVSSKPIMVSRKGADNSTRNTHIISPIVIARTALCSLLFCLLSSQSSGILSSKAYAVGYGESDGAQSISRSLSSLYGEVIEVLGRSYVDPSLDTVTRFKIFLHPNA
jgi:hypothetical protein